MSFLAPIALSLAVLAGVPVVLHLLRSETRLRVAFPAIRYLQVARRRSVRALRLRDRLLMLARAALIVVLAAAAAVPVVGSGDAADHRPTDVALVLDNSASMSRVAGSATLLEAQVTRARSALESARAGDRFWILPTVGRPVLLEGSATEARTALERVQATDGSADLGAAVTEAVRLLPAGSGRPRELHLLSDFQATAVTESLLALPGNTSLLMSRVISDSANGAILSVTADLSGPGSEASLAARLEAHDVASTDTVEVRLVVDGETIAIARAPRSGSVAFRLSALDAGEHAAHVEIPPSGLRADDRRSLVLRATDPPGIVHSGPADGYLGQALAALESAGRITLLPSGAEAAAAVIEGGSGLAVEPRGVSVFVPPADRLRLGVFNSVLARAGVPWRLETEDASGELGLATGETMPGLERVAVRSRYLLRREGAGRDSVLLRTSDDRPWLVIGEADGGRYLVLASALHPTSTDLPVRAAMVPFVEALLFDWAGLGGAVSRPSSAGVPVTLPADADSVASPGGEVVRVDGAAPYVPLHAGIHTVFRGSGSSLIAVAVPAAESDLTSISGARAARRLGRPDARSLTDDREWREAVFVARRGASAVPLLLVLVPLLAAAEMLLATPGERGRRARGVSGGEA